MSLNISKYSHNLAECLGLLSESEINKFLKMIRWGIKNNKNIFIAGNGGSASTASHMAADIAKNTNIYPIPKTQSLCDNVAWITALANDLSYDDIYSEQIITLGNRGDILIVISGSGNSENIIQAVRVAKKMRLKTVGLLGFDGGRVLRYLDVKIVCRSENYGVVESAHSFLHHFIVESLKQ